MSRTKESVIRAPERFGILAEDRDPEAYAQFIEASRHKARQFQTNRNVIVLRGHDRPGVLAGATQAVTEMGLNIEAALQGLSYGNGSLVLVTSANREVERDEVESGIRQAGGLAGWESEVVSFSNEPDGIPTNDYRLWYINASHEFKKDLPSLLGRVTRVLGQFECVLVELYSTVRNSRGDAVEHIDINVAVPASVHPGDVRAKLNSLDWTQLSFDPTDRPRFECVADGQIEHAPDNALSLAVLGDARAGLVADVVDVLEHQHDMAVFGCTMAVLEGRTAAIFTIERRDGKAIANAELDGLRASLTKTDRLHVSPWKLAAPGKSDVESVPDQEQDAGDVRGEAPVLLTWYTDERPGVLSKLSEIIGQLSINVERLSARVISDDPICVINMFLRPTAETPDDAFGRLVTNLGDLTQDGWGNGTLGGEATGFGVLY